MQRMKKGLGRPLLSGSAKNRLDARFKGKNARGDSPATPFDRITEKRGKHV